MRERERERGREREREGVCVCGGGEGGTDVSAFVQRGNCTYSVENAKSCLYCRSKITLSIQMTSSHALSVTHTPLILPATVTSDST